MGSVWGPNGVIFFCEIPVCEGVGAPWGLGKKQLGKKHYCVGKRVSVLQKTLQIKTSK
jgi:hypothetical protein